MFILLVFLLSLLIALRRGDTSGALARLHLRYLWLFFVPLALQLVIFTPLRSFIGDNATVTRFIYLASMAIAVLVLVMNRHIPGLVPIALGLLLNLLVITLNNGLMPVSPAARQFAGLPPLTGPSNNVVPITATTLLPWLSDVIPLPAWMPLANVMSIGDILIGVGGIIFTQTALAPPLPTPASHSQQAS